MEEEGEEEETAEGSRMEEDEKREGEELRQDDGRDSSLTLRDVLRAMSERPSQAPTG